ncbi:Protein CBG04913 [Caenorhabditis briggsae]|uniref:Protein CBG04913 n=1 Tax=Caenorhabditis briggsae TaxID=6238 RepID=A8WYS8_CAEBR|nr:Protein CBG04913 [Caenorhabditis briggsae]CAP25536.1 Protein CBG04913 [Caenorhabditis briggsae]
MDFLIQPSDPGNSKDHNLIWKLISISFVIVIVVLGFCILYLWIKLKSVIRKIRNPRNDAELETCEPMLPIIEPVNEPEQVVMEIPNEHQNANTWNLEYVHQIEENVYHTLGLGYITMLRRNRSTDPEQQKVIKDELRFLTEGIERHPNLLTFIGHEENGSRISIYMEHPEGGNLLKFVKRFDDSNFGNHLRNVGYENTHWVLDSRLTTLCTFDLLSFSWQIANGMKYLAGNEFVHRWLTLKNVFVTANKTIRIGNFNLTRRFGNNPYYAIVTQRTQLDLHHQAPELNSNENRFSEQSDVWSYAVSIWRLWTLGKIPYEGVENVEEFIGDGGRLSKPEYAHQEVYHYMLECWKREKLDRPTFSKLTEFFENHMDSHGLQIKRQIDQKLEASRTVQEAMEASG